MAIGPVDFRPMISKASDVARQQIEQQQKIIGHEQQQAEATIKRADQNTRSVHSQDQANKVTITEKEERNSGRQGQAKEQEEREEKRDKENQKTKPKGVHIDIRI